MPGEGDYTDTVREDKTSTVNGDKAKPVRRFTWQELSQLNEPHNAHVAVRGKVDLYTVTIQYRYGRPAGWLELAIRKTKSS